jgi:hypothetical protein
MCRGFENELPVAVASMLDGYTTGLSLFVGQFSEWSRFVENSTVVILTTRDVQQVYTATRQIIDNLKTKSDIVDPEVPKTLAWLNELLLSPASISKRSAFAMLLSIENLVSKCITYSTDFLGETFEKTKKLGSTIASRVLVASFLTLALYSTGAISGIAGKIGEMAWLNNAAKIVEKELAKLTSNSK